MITKNKLLSVISCFIVIFLTIIIENVTVLTALAIFQLVISILLERKEKHIQYTLFLIMISSIFVFYFGQLFVYYFIGHSSMDFIVIERLSKEELINATRYSLISFSVFYLGVIACKTPNNIYGIENEYIGYNYQDLKACRIIGIVFFCITIVPSLIYESSIILTSYHEGYLAGRAVSGVSGIIDDLARLCRVSIMLMMVGFRSKRIISKSLLLLFVGFSLVKMIIYGERGFAAINLIIFAWTYRNIIYKTNRKIPIKTVIGAILLVAIFAVVGEIRTVGVSGFSSKGIVEILANNVIFRELVEFGGTLLTVGYLIGLVPSTHSFIYGKTFLFGLVNMLPGGGGMDSSTASSTGMIYSIRGQSSLGGSFIADTYLNFGHFGIIVTFFFGLAFAKVLYKIAKYSRNHANPVQVVCWLSLYSSLLWLVRGTFLNLPREIEFSILPILALYYIIKKVNMKRQFIADKGKRVEVGCDSKLSKTVDL